MIRAKIISTSKSLDTDFGLHCSITAISTNKERVELHQPQSLPGQKEAVQQPRVCYWERGLRRTAPLSPGLREGLPRKSKIVSAWTQRPETAPVDLSELTDAELDAVGAGTDNTSGSKPLASVA